ncbi:MAG: transglutaminase domain-containing protein [Planctomycetes bacterium]|nr:transglutaminase domain-containing protein [Planctomycetota bacterium]
MWYPNAWRGKMLTTALVLSFLPLTALAAVDEPTADKAAPRSRTFLFTYGATVTGMKPGLVARIWLPVPPSNEYQQVRLVARELPAKGQITHDPRWHNEILYLEAAADAQGNIPLTLRYQVSRQEVTTDLKELKATREPAAENTGLAPFLKPDALVPLGGKPMDLLKGKEVPNDPLAAARVLYNVVDDHMRYSKEGTGWGRGDAVWACDSGHGNCTDFHSLFISLARSLQIPAKFEIGFPLPEKHGSGEIPGYHCWGWFHADGRWIPVDISEANKNPRMRAYYFGNLTPDRVAFTMGRDLLLEPRQAGPALNYFIYPYLEVDGHPYPAEKVKRLFSFQDLETGSKRGE